MLKQALAGGQISMIEYFVEVSVVYQSKTNLLQLENQYQKAMARIDVYKRQEYGRQASGALRHLYGPSLGTHRHHRRGSRKARLLDPSAVSYTHLDVYKRQLLVLVSDETG